MKDFGVFAICAFMYILIILLLQVCQINAKEDYRGDSRDVSSFETKQKSVPTEGQSETAKTNSSSAFDFLQITDPTTKSAFNAIYGSMQGNSECTKKTLCLAGNYLQQIPGRDFIFMFLGRYIPTDYSLLYDIFRVSVMYGQNCEAYLCIQPPAQSSA